MTNYEVRTPLEAFYWIMWKGCDYLDRLLDTIFRHD
jgi:hypothetical protein